MEQISLNTLCLFLGFLLLGTFGEAAVTNKTSVRSKCPPLSLFYSGYCYELFDDPLPWAHAYSTCAIVRPNSLLASIQSEEEMNVLSSYIRDSIDGREVWIGLRKRPNYPLRWADGSRYNYEDWYYKPMIQDNYCTVINVRAVTSGWVARSCDNGYPFMCKYQP